MTEQAKPPEGPKKRKVHPAVFIGPLVAIGAALVVIFISGQKGDGGPPPEMGPDMGQIVLAVDHA